MWELGTGKVRKLAGCLERAVLAVTLAYPVLLVAVRRGCRQARRQAGRDGNEKETRQADRR